MSARWLVIAVRPAGSPHPGLKRARKTIAEWNGRLEISDQPRQYNGNVSRNYNAHADYSELPYSESKRK
jgi:hypothetical protein